VDLDRGPEINYTNRRKFEYTAFVTQIAKEFVSKPKQYFGKRTHFDLPL